MYYLLVASVALLVSSCVTISKEQCQTTNWFEKGKLDGAAGLPATKWSKYQNQCRKAGFALTDEQNYFSGRSEGLASFCTYQNGEAYGKNGHYYYGVCPKDLEAEFLKGFRIGEKESQLRSKESALRQREWELDSRERDLANQTSDLTRKSSSPFDDHISVFGSRCVHRMADGNCAHSY